MTSFGAKSDTMNGWTQSIRTHGQVHHRISSLLPETSADHKYMQIYFMDDTAEESRTRLNIHKDLKINFIEELQRELQENNQYVRTLKTAKDVILSEQNDEMCILINEDSRPTGEHRRQYNKQLSREIAVIMPEDTRGSNRDIIIKYKGGIEQNHRIKSVIRSTTISYIFTTWRQWI